MSAPKKHCFRPMLRNCLIRPIRERANTRDASRRAQFGRTRPLWRLDGVGISRSRVVSLLRMRYAGTPVGANAFDDVFKQN